MEATSSQDVPACGVRGLVIPADPRKPTSLVQLNRDIEVNTLQDLVGGLIEVQAHHDGDIWLNEEGRLIDLPINVRVNHSKHAGINRAWLGAVAMACDLLAWLRLLCLTGDLARAEPKTLRYRILHTHRRPDHPRTTQTNHPDPRTWPWATELRDCLHAALTLPLTT
jgi:hypothetical protein